MTLAHILSTAPLPVVPLFRSSCHEIQMAFAPFRASDSLMISLPVGYNDRIDKMAARDTAPGSAAGRRDMQIYDKLSYHQSLTT